MEPKSLKETIEEFGSNDLKDEIENNPSDLNAYVGYEPSGVLHIGHLITAQKLIDLQNEGVNVKLLMADIHAKINGKGTLNEIQKIGDDMVDQLIAFGLDKNKTEVVFGSDFQYSKEYQNDLHRLNQTVSINRAKRSMSEIAGSDTPVVAHVEYPLMQALDIVHLNIDIAVGGMEQRKVHMLARDELPNIGENKPHYIHTPLISNLNGKDDKMSSSSGITISAHDSEKEVKNKVMDSYCPKERSNNPVLELFEYLVFRRFENINISRKEKFGEDLEYKNYKELENDLVSGELHPLDAKDALHMKLDTILDPIRKNL